MPPHDMPPQGIPPGNEAVTPGSRSADTGPVASESDRHYPAAVRIAVWTAAALLPWSALLGLIWWIAGD